MKKTIKLLSFVALAAFAGCAAENEPITHYSFIASAPGVVEGKLEIPEEGVVMNGTDVSLSVRLSDFATQDVTVTLAIDPELVTAYNAKNNTSYTTVPADKVTFIPEAEGATPVAGTSTFVVTIPKGAISKTVKMHVEQIAMELGERHAFGVKITKSDCVDYNERMSSMLFAISLRLPAEPIGRTNAMVVAGSNSGNIGTHIDGAWDLKLDVFTFEWWSKMTNYTTNNRALFSNWGSDTDGGPDGLGFTEIYVRFGDANRFDNTRNYVQVKFWGNETYTPAGTSATAYEMGALRANQWEHFAVLYNGSEIRFFRNGKPIFAKTNIAPPSSKRTDGKIHFQTLKMIDSGTTYWDTTGVFSDVRFWKTARTDAEIKENMHNRVYRNHPDLIGYWLFNEWKGGEVGVIEDVTGNGNDMIVTPGMATAGIFRGWQEVDMSKEGLN